MSIYLGNTLIAGSQPNSADKNLSNLSAVGQEILDNKLNKQMISNCITEIPQDIKLELNNGTLTLKAGSKVYVPNGFEEDGTTPYFDEVITTNDLTLSETQNALREKFVFISQDETKIQTMDVSNTYSGETAPSGSTYMCWYDTNNNLVKTTSNGGSSWTTLSLPIAISHVYSSGFTSIDQVFNGFGYIGSTVFALPGVKGLIPNGRNADGSLKSIMIENIQIITRTFSTAILGFCMVSPNRESYPISTRTFYDYMEENNLFTVPELNGVAFDIAEIGCDDTGKITSFTPKTSFHALDYNDKPIISGWGMPSSKYINLTLGSSESVYTAPANGTFYLSKQATGSNQNIVIRNDSNELKSKYISTGAQGCEVAMSVARGTKVTIIYTTAGTVNFFRFIYAKGEQ